MWEFGQAREGAPSLTESSASLAGQAAIARGLCASSFSTRSHKLRRKKAREKKTEKTERRRARSLSRVVWCVCVGSVSREIARARKNDVRSVSSQSAPPRLSGPLIISRGWSKPTFWGRASVCFRGLLARDFSSSPLFAGSWRTCSIRRGLCSRAFTRTSRRARRITW